MTNNSKYKQEYNKTHYTNIQINFKKMMPEREAIL